MSHPTRPPACLPTCGIRGILHVRFAGGVRKSRAGWLPCSTFPAAAISQEFFLAYPTMPRARLLQVVTAEVKRRVRNLHGSHDARHARICIDFFAGGRMCGGKFVCPGRRRVRLSALDALPPHITLPLPYRCPRMRWSRLSLPGALMDRRRSPTRLMLRPTSSTCTT